MRKRVKILDCPIDCLNMQETLQLIENAIKEKSQLQHMVVNAALLVYMQRNKELYDSIVSSDIITADGQAVVWASKILGKPLPERVAALDVMERLVRLAYEKRYKVFFLGAKEKIVKKVVEKYTNEFSSEIIAGFRNGYFSEQEEQTIAQQIANSGANMLFVAISSPKKERFLCKYKDTLKDINFMLGVGGGFDVIAGKVKRAPLWMQKSGLEWFYRLIQEPRRMWKRYLITNTLFIWMIFKEWISRSK